MLDTKYEIEYAVEQQAEIERLRADLAVAVRVAYLGVTSIAGTYNEHTPDDHALWRSFGGNVTVTAGDVRAVKAMYEHDKLKG